MGRGRAGVAGTARWVAVVLVLAATSACLPPRVGGGLLPGAGSGGSGGSSGASPRTPAPAPQTCPQPRAGEEFRRVEPEQAALDRRAVVDALTYGTARGAQSLRVYRGHCLVGTSGNDPSTEWTPLPAWSMTKGVVSLLVGRAVTLGHLSVDDPIGEHLDGLSPAHAAITVRHLLTQTSGLRFAWANDLNAAALLDSVARVLERPFEAEPGTTYVYAQVAVTVLVAVVEAATGEDLQEFAQRELFGPIGIPRTDWRWARDGAGRSHGFAFLDMAPRSFGRIGSLLLAEGRWRGRTLVDPAYVRAAATGTEANPAYGFLWWDNSAERMITAGFPAQEVLERRWLPAVPEDAFGLTGMFDQLLVVIPSLDMVVLRMGLPHELFGDPLGEVRMRRPRWDHRFFRMLLGGLTDRHLPDPGDWVPDPDPPEPDWFHLVGAGF